MRSKRNIILLGAAIAIIVAAGIYLFMRLQTPKPNTFLSGISTGQGMEFFAPAQLKIVPGKSKNVKFLTETYAGGNKTKTTLVVTTTPLTNPSYAATQFSQAIASKSNTNYAKYNLVITRFILNTSASGPLALNLVNPADSKLSLSSPVAFSNKHIKSNAWQFNYSLIRPSPPGQKLKVDGTLIYVYGQKAYYRLLLSSVDDNWQANLKTWDKVTNSLNINR